MRRPAQSGYLERKRSIDARFRPQMVTIFSYRKTERCPFPKPIFLKSRPPHCKAISASKRALSAPLSHFSYSHQEKAFSNQIGYTWTPSYLRYCQPTISEQFNNRNTGNSCNNDRNNDDRLSAMKWCETLSLEHAKLEPIIASYPTPDAEPRKQLLPVSYSKFMESPYLRKPGVQVAQCAHGSVTFTAAKTADTANRIKVTVTQH